MTQSKECDHFYFTHCGRAYCEICGLSLHEIIANNFILKSEVESKIMKAEIEQCRNIHKLNGNIDQRYLIDRQDLLNSLLNKKG